MNFQEEVNELYEYENWPLMVKTAREWCKAEPKNADAWFNVGMASFEMQKFGAALDAFQRAVALSPRWARAWGNVGVVHLCNGEYQKAVEAHEKAEKIAPKDTSLLFGLGNAYLHTNNAKFWDVMEKLEKLDPDKASRLESCMCGMARKQLVKAGKVK